MRPLAAAFLGVVALGLVACWPVSVNPIRGTATTTVDSRLTGTWVGRFGDKSDDQTYIHFLPAENGTVSIVTVRATASDNGWAHYSATSTELQGTNYLNVRAVSSDGKVEDSNFSRFFTLARYVETDGKLDVFTINQDKLVSLIESGALKGEVKRSEITTDVKITAESAELDAFLAKSNPTELFSEHLVEVTRVSKTVTP